MHGAKILERLGELGGERRIDYTLERFQEALKSLGSPERDVYALVIGGTNGKGTTALYVSSALSEAGFKVVTYLSPHLVHPSERFLLNLEAIPGEELDALSEELFPTATRYRLTYFEFLTLIVFIWAKRVQADFLVLEVGLGGRLDATNVTFPLATAITNVSFDHMDFLGNTLEAILEEKLGILRPEGLFFTGIQDPALLQQVQRRCDSLDTIYYYSREIRKEVVHAAWEGQKVLLNGHAFTLSCPSPGALENAALAFLLMQIVFPRIPIETLTRAFDTVKNPGRFQVIRQRPRVVVSGDHNAAGIADLVATLDRVRAKNLRIVCGFSPDKPYPEMYRKLAALTDDITLVPVRRGRGAYGADYAKMGRFMESPPEAVSAVLSRSSVDDTILVTGSLYLVGDILTTSASFQKT